MKATPSTLRDQLDRVPVRNVKAGLRRGEGALQKLNLAPAAGEALDIARGNARLEPKQMASDMGISHSLVLRGLKSLDHLSFHRLWALSDRFWLELIVAIAKTRRIANVRTSIDVDADRRAS